MRIPQARTLAALPLLWALIAALVAAPSALAQTTDPGEGEAQPEAPAAPAGFLGVRLGAIDAVMRDRMGVPEGVGLAVTGVAPGSPADGVLRAQDVLISFDGTSVTSEDQFRALVAGKIGERVAVGVIRERNPLVLELTVAADATGEGDGRRDADRSGAGFLRNLLDRAFREGDRADPDEEEGENGGGGSLLPEGLLPPGIEDQLRQFERDYNRYQDLLREREGDHEGDAIGRLLGDLLDRFTDDNPLPDDLEDFLDRLDPDRMDEAKPLDLLPDSLRQYLDQLPPSMREQLEEQGNDMLRGLLRGLNPFSGQGEGGGDADPEAPIDPMVGRPYVGASVVEDMDEADGASSVRVVSVADGSPAEDAGLEVDDVIIQFGDREVETRYDIRNAIAALVPGDVVDVIVIRDGQRQTLTLTLGEA